MKLTEVIFKTVPVKKFTNYRDLGYKYKVVRVPALKDQVQGKRIKNTTAPCVNEMTVMMDCWKIHDFNQSLCVKEMKLFQSCMAAAEVEANAQKERVKQGLPEKGSRMRPSKQVNEMLARYPQPPAHFE